MLSPILSPRVYDALLPRPPIRTVDWSEEHLEAPPPVVGPIRFDLFPYMREPLDCCDSPDFDRVTIQAATRTGKTVAAQCFVLRKVAVDPHLCLWGEPDEDLCKRVIRRTWDMAECPALLDQLPPRRRRSADRMSFTSCEVLGVWSGSKTRLADSSAQIIVKNELSKWSRRKDRGDAGEDISEADPAFLVDERAKGYPGATIVEISTPTVAGHCRIEAQRLKGDNRRYLVPCPFCNHFQTLRSGNGRDPGGLRWEKGSDGHSQPDIAAATAWYECEKCRKKIRDEHRYDMIGAGRWVKEGQSLDKRGRLRGRAKKPHSRHASFGPISTLYSLLPKITFGLLAGEYVEAKQDKSGQRWRHYLNSTEGVTYDPAPLSAKPHELAVRLKGETVRGLCPEWSAFLTVAVDVGSIGELLIFYWQALAWGPLPAFAETVPAKRGQVVDFGTVSGREAFLALLAGLKVPHADGGSELPWSIGGVDTGYQGPSTDAKEIYDLCGQVKGLWPLKGSSHRNWPDLYDKGFKRADASSRELRIKRKLGAPDLLIVNTTLTQSWRENLVCGRTRREDGEWVGLPSDVCDDHEAHAELFDELLSDRLIEGRWERTGDNEQGDLLRYNRALAELFTRGGKLWGNLHRTGTDAAGSQPTKRPKSAHPFVRSMSGRNMDARF